MAQLNGDGIQLWNQAIDLPIIQYLRRKPLKNGASTAPRIRPCVRKAQGMEGWGMLQDLDYHVVPHATDFRRDFERKMPQER